MRFCSSHRSAATLFLLIAFLVSPATQAAQEPKAVEIAERALAAMGGHDSWNQTRNLVFTFAVVDGENVLVERTHYWDKWSQMHRVEGVREGASFVVIENLETKQGRAWLDGTELEGEAVQEWLGRAWSMWVNDTYWLLMPYKMLDPGVNLAYDGEETIDETVYDKLHLSFDGVGLTPGDQYWAWINRETGLMDQWGFVLQNQEPPARIYRWTPWRPYGDVRLAAERVPAEGTRRISFRDLAAPPSLPEELFTSLEAPEATTIIVRATSRDAKIIGSNVGGARITVTDVETGEVLAAGEQQGSTGNTDRIVREPHPRDGTVYDTEGAASFMATLLLDEPTVVRIDAEGPLEFPQVGGRASKTMLLTPGEDVRGEGVLLEIHGFIVEILEAEALAEEPGGHVYVKARVRMTCGCPTEPGGLWDADEIEIMARLYASDGTLVAEAPMEFTGEESEYEATILAPSAMKVQVFASQPSEGNFGRSGVESF